MKIALSKGKYFYWEKGDLHTHKGLLKESDMKLSKAKTNKGIEFSIFNANFNDQIKKFKRGPQAMMMKDIAYILLKLDINSKSKVLEAGTGSGVLTSYIARQAKEVYSYDIKEDNQNLAKKNLANLKLKNVTFKIQDIIEKIDEKNFDSIILDLPNAEKALENCHKALKQGGYLSAYLPNMTQVIDFVKVAEKLFQIEETIDIMHQPWEVTALKAKPIPRDMLHTAFLVFCRKV
jgi:tRNA (adenine57-N1/adenine58-N1)-methyltransferase catalytic subunit